MLTFSQVKSIYRKSSPKFFNLHPNARLIIGLPKMTFGSSVGVAPTIPGIHDDDDDYEVSADIERYRN